MDSDVPIRSQAPLCSSVQFSRSVLSDSLRLHGLQHARPPCPSPTPGAWLKLMSIESVMPSNHLIFGCPLLLPPTIFSSIRVFSPARAARGRRPVLTPRSLASSASCARPAAPWESWAFWSSLYQSIRSCRACFCRGLTHSSELRAHLLGSLPAEIHSYPQMLLHTSTLRHRHSEFTFPF